MRPISSAAQACRGSRPDGCYILDGLVEILPGAGDQAGHLLAEIGRLAVRAPHACAARAGSCRISFEPPRPAGRAPRPGSGRDSTAGLRSPERKTERTAGWPAARRRPASRDRGGSGWTPNVRSTLGIDQFSQYTSWLGRAATRTARDRRRSCSCGRRGWRSRGRRAAARRAVLPNPRASTSAARSEASSAYRWLKNSIAQPTGFPSSRRRRVLSKALICGPAPGHTREKPQARSTWPMTASAPPRGWPSSRCGRRPRKASGRERRRSPWPGAG